MPHQKGSLGSGFKAIVFLVAVAVHDFDDDGHLGPAGALGELAA